MRRNLLSFAPVDKLLMLNGDQACYWSDCNSLLLNIECLWHWLECNLLFALGGNFDDCARMLCWMWFVDEQHVKRIETPSARLLWYSVENLVYTIVWFEDMILSRRLSTHLRGLQSAMTLQERMNTSLLDWYSSPSCILYYYRMLDDAQDLAPVPGILSCIRALPST